jgi:hypothetical protein
MTPSAQQTFAHEMAINLLGPAEQPTEPGHGADVYQRSGATEPPACSTLVTKGDVIARTSAP